ncbi:MAG: gamma-butyrobetaine hydroxylase-like domain-containing protein [Bosea sp. (in: a-proteobacteria)]
MSAHWPTEIRLAKDKKSLTIIFEDGATFMLPAEYLRVESPSAEVQGHSPSEKKTISGKVNVEIIAVTPVGNYAVKLAFDDMHDTGIYGWDALYEMGQRYDEKWQAYLDDLASKGLSRERR